MGAPSILISYHPNKGECKSRFSKANPIVGSNAFVLHALCRQTPDLGSFVGSHLLIFMLCASETDDEEEEDEVADDYNEDGGEEEDGSGNLCEVLRVGDLCWTSEE
ncbi:hypothetical protein SLEP1_g27527 [Rubroshorea leprosula]|uniref:Uncharacterized protein n=1 Tax=Rubroshorea leprosula TaxID=152421 RepID=A0AAV5JX69_9ROSI|nr:hypothetical protein SLEP1_g27527 [Rubroshorea leprosula]